MIKIRFEDFENANYNDDKEDYKIYLVRNANGEILYVGISRTSVWNRWFGNFGRMQRAYNGEFIPSDSVSNEIYINLPLSLNWTIELLTVRDGYDIISDEWRYPDIPIGDNYKTHWINEIEKLMIKKLKPKLNYTYNA